MTSTDQPDALGGTCHPIISSSKDNTTKRKTFTYGQFPGKSVAKG